MGGASGKELAAKDTEIASLKTKVSRLEGELHAAQVAAQVAVAPAGAGVGGGKGGGERGAPAQVRRGLKLVVYEAFKLLVYEEGRGGEKCAGSGAAARFTALLAQKYKY